MMVSTTKLSLPVKRLWNHQLTYKQRLPFLKQEANLAAHDRPQHLTVLAGDSLSDWFPRFITPKRTWLNHGFLGDFCRMLRETVV